MAELVRDAGSPSARSRWTCVDGEPASRHRIVIVSDSSDDERMGHAFRKLDQNGSGALEREDLTKSMRRQLGRARRLDVSRRHGRWASRSTI